MTRGRFASLNPSTAALIHIGAVIFFKKENEMIKERLDDGDDISRTRGRLIFKTLTIMSEGDGTVTEPGIGTFNIIKGKVINIIGTEPSFVKWEGPAVTAGKVANPNAASTTVLVDDNYGLLGIFSPL